MTVEDKIYRKAKETISNFGEKPTKDVGAILNIVQSFELSENSVMDAVHSIYIRLCQEIKNVDAKQAHQSWVSSSGGSFENIVRNFINESLNSEGILAVKGDNLRKNGKTKDIVEFLTLKASRRCTQTNTGVWPDSDIVVLTKEKNGKLKAFALLNCKTSDHSRNDAVLFWALALRDNNIKYCLVTSDLDYKFKKGDYDKQISGFRRKCEAYLDRVYTTNPITEECSQIRKLDFWKPQGAQSFLSELRIWRKEVVPDFINQPIDENALL